MVVTGAIPYEDFKEKDRIVTELLREFNRKVKVHVDSLSNIITYWHYDETYVN